MNQYCLKQSQLNTTDSNPCSQFLLTVMAGLLQLERELTSTRVKEGLTALRGKMNLPIGNSMPTKTVPQSHYGGPDCFVIPP